MEFDRPLSISPITAYYYQLSPIITYYRLLLTVLVGGELYTRDHIIYTSILNHYLSLCYE